MDHHGASPPKTLDCPSETSSPMPNVELKPHPSNTMPSFSMPTPPTPSATTHDATTSPPSATASASTPANAGNDASRGRTPPVRSNKRKRATAGAAAAGGASAAAARTVANLTPEQLERKRANDREAQRAIRERTRNQIERLNKRIEEFERGQPWRDFLDMRRHKDEVVRENAEMRKTMGEIMGLCGAFLGGDGGGGTLGTAPQAGSSPENTQQTTPISNHLSPPSRAVSTSQQASQYPNLALHPPTEPVRSASNSAPTCSNDERLAVPFLIEQPATTTSSTTTTTTTTTTQAQTPHPQSGTYPPPQSGSPLPSIPPSPYYALLPRNSPPKCYVDEFLMNFLTTQKSLSRSPYGSPPGARQSWRQVMLDPTYPNFDVLVDGSKGQGATKAAESAYTLSGIFPEMLSCFPALQALPEQVAVVYIMFLVTRWLIKPSRETFERLPYWVRPTVSQIMVEHPFWLDFLPWPHLRHVALLQNPHTDFNEFFVPYTTTLSLNWPHDPSTVLVPNPRRHRHHVSQQPSYLEHVYHNPTLAHPNAPHFDQKHRRTKGADEKGEDDSDWEEDTYWIINPDFEEHLRDLGNWTLGGAFRDAFPHFKDYVKFHSGV